MNDSLQTSFWVMVLVQTIGSVDVPGRGARKMPAPRQYVAIVATWVVLQLISKINDSTERAAAAFSWVIVLAGLVVGPFGQRLVSLFQAIAQNFPAATPVTSTSSPITTLPGGIAPGPVTHGGSAGAQP